MGPFSNKSKVVVFGDAGLQKTFVWSYSGFPLQQVSSYRYLGVILSNTGSFTTAVKTLCQSALKVLNLIQTGSREHGGFSPDVMCLLSFGTTYPGI